MRFFLLLLCALVLAAPVAAAPAPAPACRFDPALISPGQTFVLSAENLPVSKPFAFTFEPYPIGTSLLTADGTFSINLTFTPVEPVETLTAYFWVRGGGKSLIKSGPQLNDYRVVAMCSAAVV